VAQTAGTGRITSEFKWDDATTATQYTVAKFSATNVKGQVGVSGATTEYPVGILQNAPAQGQAASLQYDGESYLIASGAVALGDRIVVTTGGKGLTDNTRGTTLAAASDYRIGTAMSAGVDGKLFKIRINIQETDQD